MSHPTPPSAGTPAIDLTDAVIPTGRALPEGAAEALRAELRGQLLTRADAEYDAARRVWNGMIDRRPLLIARCSGPADVVAAVNFARTHAVPLSVRGGGHNVAGGAIQEGGLVIDLSPMRSVRVDPDARTVRVGGGATLGDVDHETQVFGLAVPAGVVSRTGIGGLSLHGGMGFLTRRYGLTSDNLIGADVVTADGSLITVDAAHHPDLLWALRGGGGTFGVVTSFEFQAHPVPREVWVALAMYPVANAAEVLRFFCDFMATAPDELMAIALLWNAPAEGPFPEEALGAPVVVLAGCYSGDPENGEDAIRPLREVATPLLDLSGAMPFAEAQCLFDPDYPDGRRYYWKSTYLHGLDDDAIRVLVDSAAARPSSLSSIDVWALGGAMARVAPEDTAFPRRDAPFLLGIEANWDDPAGDEANVRWARALFREAQRHSPGGSYLNFPGFAEEGEDLLKDSYGVNYDRLRRIKAKYDPDDLFRGALGVPPAR